MSTSTRPAPDLGTASRWRNLALYAFAVFGWELVVGLALDGAIRGAVGERWAPAVHWLVTAAGWLAGALLLLRHAPWRSDDPVAAPAGPGRARRAAYAAAALVLAVGSRAALTHEWKPLAEAVRLHDDVGSAFAPSLAALVVYYLAEVLVIVTLLGYGQRWGEAARGRSDVPWGGLVLAATWGLVHVLLQGPAGGAYAMGAAVLYGVLHRAVRGHLGLTYALVATAFVL
ncbi:MAG: hypothetical protein J7503_09390 [Cellulomonas iranensis]|uniref:hypothetical protein n=1 Tax=Cellulomonas iranensis TaxID=76862 RepID=UPI001B0A28A3|nr:hypothetical protein [Cellulomonas iranensis]MBO9569028.1 hypothetical protein [Cellulomonas iranensis]